MSIRKVCSDAGSRLCTALLVVFGVLRAPSAHAAGVEDTPGGTVGLGRAAYFARVNDFMAIMQNPANLAVVPGGAIGGNLGFEVRLPVLSACFDRYRDPAIANSGMSGVGYKDPGTYEGYTGSESFDEVCNEAFPGPTANLGWAQSFEGWGYGVGVFTPAAVGANKYGDDTIVTWYPQDDERYQVTETGAESPNRQLGLERDGAIAWMMAGVAAQPMPFFRFGVSAGWGFANVYNKSVVSVLGGTFQDQEVLNELRVRDRAVPRMVASIVVSPFDWLDLFAVTNYQADINAKGTAVLTANGISGAPLKNCGADNPGTHCKIDGVRLKVPFPTIETTFGVRVSVPRKKRERVLDPFYDEWFDIEADVSWAQTSHVDAMSVRLHDKTSEDADIPRIQFANKPDASFAYIRQRTAIPKQWKDTWTLRAGGDLNVWPGRLTLRAGVSYAPSAQPAQYTNIDYWPVEKLGLHAGFTVGILPRIRASVGYAHLFSQQVDVAVGTGGIKDIASIDEVKSTGVNEGFFRAGLDVFSLQLNAQF